MPEETDDRANRFTVTHNDEEQYSVWWDERPLPAGWYRSGFEGTREECLAHIDTVWTDMRPKSLREFMDAGEAAGGART